MRKLINTLTMTVAIFMLSTAAPAAILCSSGSFFVIPRETLDEWATDGDRQSSLSAV